MNVSSVLAAQEQVPSIGSAIDPLDPLVIAARACELGAPGSNVAVALLAYAAVQLIGRAIDRVNLRGLAPRRVVYGEEDREMLRKLHGEATARAKSDEGAAS